MADSDGAKQPKRAKRRVRPVESVREQREKIQGDQKTKRRPIRKLLHWAAKPFRWIASWRFWQSKAWKPFRFVGKILSYVLFIRYIRNSIKELRLVTWPNWKQSWRLTWAVLVFSIFFGIILAVVDFGLDKLFKKLILNA